VRVLSFDEMMRLSKAKRATYITGLRSMMKEIDQITPKLRASTSEDFSRSQIALLLELYDSTETSAFAGTSSQGDGLPFNGARHVQCYGGLTALEIKNRTAGKTKESSDATTYVCAQASAAGQTPCSGDQVPVMQQADGSFYCATKVSFDRLEMIMKGNARTSGVAKPGFLDDKEKKVAFKNFAAGPDAAKFKQLQIQKLTPAEAAKDAQTKLDNAPLLVTLPPGAAKARASAEPVRGGAAVTLGAPPSQVPIGPKTGSSVPGRLAVVAASGSSEPAVTAPLGPAASSADAKTKDPKAAKTDDGVIVVAPAGDSKKPAAKDPKTEPADPPATTDVPDALAKCDPDSETPKTCDPGEVEAARSKYASDQTQLDCIYAGGISTYLDGKKRAYHCQAPTKFCFASTTCSNKTDEDVQVDYSCKSNQIICNPLVFGLKANGDAVCVSKSAHATSQCDEEAPSAGEGISPLDEKHPGIKDAWNDFADRLFNLCHTDQTAATLHCAECDIIAKRLFKLNVAARDVKNCGAAIKFQKENCGDDGSCSQRPGTPQKKAPKTDGAVASAFQGARRSVSSIESRPQSETTTDK
jgi:hypothetical protein